MTHIERLAAVALIQKLEEARNIVAAARSSIFLPAGKVDPVTLSIVHLQEVVLACLQSDEVPRTLR